MTDKTIQELALSVNRPVEKLLEQVRDAGLPQRKSDDIISTEQQRCPRAPFEENSWSRRWSGRKNHVET